VNVKKAKTLLKATGFTFGLFCLSMSYASAIRLYDRLSPHRSVAPQDGVSAALDIGGNVLLLIMSILGVVTVLYISRKGVDVIRNWPYVAPGILVAVFWATMAATLGAGRMTWVLPAAGVGVLMGLVAGWSTLLRHGLPITARASDVPTPE